MNDRAVRRRLQVLLRSMRDVARAQQGTLRAVPIGRRRSAANLIDYLALRRYDLRTLQIDLADRGLSSLGRCESATRASIAAVLAALGEPVPRQPGAIASLAEGRDELRAQADRVFGAADRRRSETPRIMVTMPTEAAADPRLVRDLLLGGMQIMRINCAHDSDREWSAMISHARAAMRRTGRACRVLMDIAGPKVRTGSIEPGPRVAHWNPPRDALGTLTRRAMVFLYPMDTVVPAVRQLPSNVDETLPLDAAFLRALKRGERIEFIDARGTQRELVVEMRGSCRFAPLDDPIRGVFASSPHAAYVVPGTTLTTQRSSVVVGDLPRAPRSIVLFEGDLLVLTADQTPGRDCDASEKGRHPPASRERFAARVPFTLPRVLREVRPGHRVMFDDGKISGHVIAASPKRALIRITASRPEGTRLAADKGVNLPDTPMRIGALSDRDRADLDFVARHADLVGLSFARERSDLRDLRRELAKRGASHLGVILKIETARAFENLPDLLLEGLRSDTFGVMIARGDLAVEIGWERLAEVQEEILCLCEAAHTPVVWATQVLESLAKKGVPSRSEITDAAMSHRAECVMLNKGRYVVRAVRALRDILRRMEGHQSKRRQMLRALHVAERFVRRR